MTAADPTHYIWWLISRASGIVAVTLISAVVLMGLAMAARLVPARRKRGLVSFHEHLAIAALVTTAVHGATLLGDGWLRPGLAGITIPFAVHYRPAFTGAGIVAGYLAVLLGPTFYLRRRIGARVWRRMHRVTPVIWILAVIHTLGAGSDGSSAWLRAVVLAPVSPMVYLLAARMFTRRRSGGVHVSSAATAAKARPEGGRASAAWPPRASAPARRALPSGSGRGTR